MAPILSCVAGWTTVFLAAVTTVDGFWRLPCQGRSGLARIDPLISPGVPSSHAHAIHGGSNFGMDSTYDDLRASECTSCSVTQDRSAYWTPALYFLGSNGEYQLVTQVGGTLVYYLLYGDNIQAYPAGFRMIAGDTSRRNITVPVPDPPQSNWGPSDQTQDALAQKAIGFNCLDYSKNPPEGSLSRHNLPDKAFLDANCKDGVRFELMFPSCWNGELDSPDHKSHLAYPNLVKTGTCPPGFDKRLISMFYETIWNTTEFVGQSGQFIIANGDPTGFGYHGDFIAGWDPAFLQQATDQCTNPSGQIQDCPLFTIQDQDAEGQCKIQTPPVLAQENCASPGGQLPGEAAIQSGPQPATEAPAATSAAAASSASASSSGGAGAEFAVAQAVGAGSPPAPTPPPAAPPAAANHYATTLWETINGTEVVEILVTTTETTVVVTAAPAAPTGDNTFVVARAAPADVAVEKRAGGDVDAQPIMRQHQHHHRDTNGHLNHHQHHHYNRRHYHRR
ncbi:MAG: hypothetical protein M1838_000574 [Thelocarpon superellum]|nr:MAG: hypothetical protein M1838_000574 [Thelocarpon superellum]